MSSFQGTGQKFFVLAILVCSALFFLTATNLLGATGATTSVRHDAVAYFVPEHRIQLGVSASDEEGVELVRCYFKAAGEADYVFVPMTRIGGNDYAAVLPAPSPNCLQIEYLFLIVNTRQQVSRTQVFVIDQKDAQDGVPEWQNIPRDDEIQLYTELSEPPETLAGFSDSIVMDSVESSVRFGAVVALYKISTATAGAGTAGGTATSAGTVTASAGTASAGASTAGVGLSTTAIVAGTAAGVAAAGGIALATVDGSDGDKKDGPMNTLASVTWGDQLSQVGFDMYSGDDYLGVNPSGGPSGTITKTGFTVGEHQLTIKNTSTAADNSFIIQLGGGVTFDDGSTRKTGNLSAGDTRSYKIVVPELIDTTVTW